MVAMSANQNTGREILRLEAQPGSGRAIGCELQVLPDWRQACPGRKTKVVGLLDVQDHGPRGTDIRLKDAIVMDVSGNRLPEVAAEVIGKAYAAKPAEFDKKWKVEDKYYYVIGTLKTVEKLPLPGGRFANKFRVAAGPVDLHCNILNEHGVDADPPGAGDKVTLLLECLGYASSFEAIGMTGVYAGKGP